MEIIRAKHSGFCFGVRQAIEKTYAQLDQEHRGAIYTCGPLIHNTSVTDSLKENGVGIIHDLSETAPGDTVIIRSHGEPKTFYDQAATMDLEIVDATCPFVARIHQLVNKAFHEGRPIIIVGDRTHPEVIGINGWCNDQAFIAHSSEDARRFEESEAFLVCQTTLNEKVLQEVVSVLQEKGVDLDIQNTICNATRDRQKAADELSQKVDMMLVIGGRNSSNTRKLYEICAQNCLNTYFIENIGDLPLKQLKNSLRMAHFL